LSGTTPFSVTWNYSFSMLVTQIPQPPTFFLVAFGLAGLGLLGWLKKKKAAAVAIA
jgi:hypothetical protein